MYERHAGERELFFGLVLMVLGILSSRSPQRAEFLRNSEELLAADSDLDWSIPAAEPVAFSA